MPINITNTKFHQLLMYVGRIPTDGNNIEGAVGIMRRALSLMAVAGLNKSPHAGRVMDDYLNNTLHAIDLLYGYPTEHLRYQIAIEYIDRVRKLMKEEQEFYHSRSTPNLHACKRRTT